MTDHTRHSGIFAPIEGRITLIGAGGIGAITAVVLSKMTDAELVIFDGDNVDPINIATQFHQWPNIGENKAVAVAEMARQFSDSVTPEAYACDFPCEDYLAGKVPASQFIISAVDSIKSRKTIWNCLKEGQWEFYLDARMSAEVFQLYVVDREDYIWYSLMLDAQNDEEISDAPCTAKATIYTAAFAAGHIGKTLRELVTGRTPPKFLEHDLLSERITVAYGSERRP